MDELRTIYNYQEFYYDERYIGDDAIACPDLHNNIALMHKKIAEGNNESSV